MATGPQPEYRISLTLAVTDPRALWAAAAGRLMAAPGMTEDNVVDVLGPCEDPSIRDCIAMLANPGSLPGCALDDFWIDALQGCPPRTDTWFAAPGLRLELHEKRARRPAPRRSSASVTALAPGASPTLRVCNDPADSDKHAC